MRRSRYFLPTLRENPAEAQIASHRLMLRAGMIRQSSAGIYSWLPLGHRVLRKIEQVVREEMDAAGCQEILMPAIQPAELWEESGRYHDYGKEMLRITDRHERAMLFGPTHEEVVTDIFRQSVRSYRDLPQNLYQIQWKFRDELRPRFGIMRGREFYMKDNYSFDLDHAGAVRSYNRMFVAYLRTFARLGLTSIPMQAESGAIGGDYSHEFIVLADTGESAVYCDPAWLDTDPLALAIDYEADLQPIVDEWTRLYAATDDKHDPDACAVPADTLYQGRGIEVGHIFYFGTKYSKAMGATVTDPEGAEVPVEMGSYGIGVSRLAGRDHRGEPRRGRHHLARGGGPLQGRPHQPPRRRRGVRRGVRYALHAPRGSRRRGAVRRPRRAGGRQVRGDGADRAALAGRRRPARHQGRYR